ncbi:MAG TPA: hypothetical protein VFX14_12390 [Methylomirabilota bacterium]|nr:hypothetical protein [Methylomirabilota bacterium]
MRRPPRLLRAVLLAAASVLALAGARPVAAQLFFSSEPDSPARIGPLIVRASVAPGRDTTDIDILWSVSLPPRASLPPQPLYLLWPGEVSAPVPGGKPDPALAKAVTDLGFDVVGEGRLPLYTQNLSDPDAAAKAQPVEGGAPYVTFVQYGGALGLSPPATWIQIPATPRLADPKWLIELRMQSHALVKPRQASWLERVIQGQRYMLTISFNEVRDRPLFPMYFAHRDRALHLADAPAELVIHFPQSDQLKIDDVYPRTTIRRLSETLESTEVVSLFLDTSEGISPQHLSIQYGYFSKLQGALLVIVPMLFLALGYAVGPALGRVGAHIASSLITHVYLGGWNRAPRDRVSGTLLGDDVIARIVPGRTTLDEVLALAGPDAERNERLAPQRGRTLVYRGRRVRPQTGRIVGWFSTVRHFNVEEQTVTIDFDGDIVKNIQAEVRRSRSQTG